MYMRLSSGEKQSPFDIAGDDRRPPGAGITRYTLVGSSGVA
jgi:hypothetical protein